MQNIKKFYGLIIIILLLVSCSKVLPDRSYNDREAEGFFGPVKSCTHIIWFIYPSGDGFEKDFISKSRLVFNKNGTIRKRVSYQNRFIPDYYEISRYYGNGSLKKRIFKENIGMMIFQRDSWADYSINESGQISESVSLNSRGWITSWTTYDYLDSELLEMVTRHAVANYNDRFDPDFYVNKRTSYLYDNRGLKIEQIDYDGTNAIMKSIQYTWSDSGKITLITTVDKDGSVDKILHYQYDDQDQMIISDNTNSKEETKTVCRYHYGSDGFLIKTVNYHEDEMVDDSTEYHHDSYGNTVIKNHFDSDGMLEKVEEFTYRYFLR